MHVLAAILWLGGRFFPAAVGAPTLREVEPRTLRAELFHRIGEQFRRVGWVAIGVLIVTGVLNIRFHGVLSGAVPTDGEFRATGYGRALADGEEP